MATRHILSVVETSLPPEGTLNQYRRSRGRRQTRAKQSIRQREGDLALPAPRTTPPHRDRHINAWQTPPGSNTMKKKFLAVAIALLAASSPASAAQATMGQREALDAAKSYLRSGHFSRAGLIDQLESPYGEDFSHSEAVWGVNHAHANWYAEAVEAAKSYLRSGHFSRRGLIDQLESPYGEHFTHAQAVYGVSKAYR
jgi:hypothetical protein